jgi:hypothetical protein
MRDALHLNETREFRWDEPRPRRGSKPVSGGPQAARISSGAPPTPHAHAQTNTGDPHC